MRGVRDRAKRQDSIIRYLTLHAVLKNNIFEYKIHLGSFQATTKALDEPSKCLTEPKRAFAAPKCLILYTPEAADSGILHSIVALLRVLSLAGLDHINRRQKSSSS